mmetsp:Transcript_8929/g.17254  ORF Transcript_8929/g.17254 Transcript_8929/m.17254 type:complete len:873 (+) Transcript_8929:27-2645(+)
MANKLPAALDELFKFTVDVTNLKTTLEYLADWNHQNSEGIKATNGQIEESTASIRKELARLPTLESDVKSCLDGLGEVQRISDKVTAWSERFIALEERLFTLENDLRHEVHVIKETHTKSEAKLEREINGVRTSLELEFRHKFELLEKSHSEQLAAIIKRLDEKHEANEAALKDTDFELRGLIDARFDQLTALISEMDKVDEGESGDSDMEGEVAENPASSMASPKQSRPGSSLDTHHFKDMRKVKNLHLRVLNLEKRMAKLQSLRPETNQHQRASSQATVNIISEMRFEDAAHKEDMEHEAHLKLLTLLKETQELKDMMKSMSKAHLPDVKLETAPNFKQYVPYMVRIQALEERLLDFNPGEAIYSESGERDWFAEIESKADAREVTRLAKAVKDLSSQLQKMQTERKRSMHEAEMHEERSLHESHHKTEDIVPSFSSVHESSVEDSITKLQESITKMAAQLNNKVSKTELEKFIRVKTNTSHSAEPSQEAKEDSTFIQLEERLNRYYFELKELKEALKTNLDAIREEVYGRLKQISQDAEENLSGVHSHLMAQITDINDAISSPAESSDSANLAVMRAMNARLQKDVREMRIELNEYISQRSRSMVSEVAQLTPSDPTDEIVESGAHRSVSSTLQKHEALFKTLQNQIQTLNSEFETQQSIIKKTQEQQVTQSIKQLEELRYNVSEIMAKLQEGNKLNQRDLEKLNELYRMLEGKSDREEILQKVDKRDLNRAYRFLSKKIETLGKEVEKSERASTSHVDEPAAVRKKLDAQCLACGQDINPIPLKLDREWKSWGKFPPNTYRFGPGFSKILPILKGSVDPGQRSESIKTDRARNGSNPDLRRSISDLAHISLPSTQRTLKLKNKQESPK